MMPIAPTITVVPMAMATPVVVIQRQHDAAAQQRRDQQREKDASHDPSPLSVLMACFVNQGTS
ncbi:MAG: hypothetical protein KDH15_05975 [Rhodocyclaceae bacterium]|nr:hypothetical protein [Rhodocyclaceae bacterium]